MNCRIVFYTDSTLEAQLKSYGTVWYYNSVTHLTEMIMVTDRASEIKAINDNRIRLIEIYPEEGEKK